MSLYDLTVALAAVEEANDPDALYEANEALYAAAKDHVTNERRMADSAARQRAYAADPQRAVERADRIAKGLCVIVTEARCVTHDATADFGHYLSVNPSHSAQGIATND